MQYPPLLVAAMPDTDMCGVFSAGNTVNTPGSKADDDPTPSRTAKGEADNDGLFSSSGFLETFGKGAQMPDVEQIGAEHKQAAKQSKWSPVTLWRKAP